SLWVYKELIFPYLKMLVDAAHKKHIYFIHHTDGYIWPIIDDLINTGIDALHSIDPSAGMKLAEVKEKYGGKTALCGNVDAATTMAYGTTEQVAEETKQCIRDGASGGGYFLTTSNCIYKGIPPNNTITLTDVGKKYGRYPL
ncbi:MAG: nucleoside 2-deoxyribosyltransferase, partial [Candidatus Thorarchaeota archaeon]